MTVDFAIAGTSYSFVVSVSPEDVYKVSIVAFSIVTVASSITPLLPACTVSYIPPVIFNIASPVRPFDPPAVTHNAVTFPLKFTVALSVLEKPCPPP